MSISVAAQINCCSSRTSESVTEEYKWLPDEENDETEESEQENTNGTVPPENLKVLNSHTKNTGLSLFQMELLNRLDNARKENDADKLFLLSLLPDYKSLNDEQKVDFRIYILQFFKDIERPTTTTTHKDAFGQPTQQIETIFPPTSFPQSEDSLQSAKIFEG